MTKFKKKFQITRLLTKYVLDYYHNPSSFLIKMVIHCDRKATNMYITLCVL